MTWDEYFMNIAWQVSKKSKDESTHLGCVIAGENNEIRSVGYNCFPRYIDDDRPERQERPEKYFWFEHAERNAIYNAAFAGISLKDCTAYVTGMPCADCARALIQSGIKKVVIDDGVFGSVEENKKRFSNTWRESMIRALIMFKEAGIKFGTPDKPLYIGEFAETRLNVDLSQYKDTKKRP